MCIGYLTGITKNAWSYYDTFSKVLNFEVSCLQLNVTGASNTSFDALASVFLGRRGQNVGVNASAAGVFFLKQPDSNINVTNKEFAWDAYGSQVFVNKDSWENFTSGGQKKGLNATSGAAVIPGTKPFQVSLYSKLIDSNAVHGSNATNIDTVFLWGKQIKFFNPGQYNKRSQPKENVYGVILSKTSKVADDVFNKTLTLLPQYVIANNVSIVKLNDTCYK
jgi:hypothetical protein